MTRAVFLVMTPPSRGGEFNGGVAKRREKTRDKKCADNKRRFKGEKGKKMRGKEAVARNEMKRRQDGKRYVYASIVLPSALKHTMSAQVNWITAYRKQTHLWKAAADTLQTVHLVLDAANVPVLSTALVERQAMPGINDIHQALGAIRLGSEGWKRGNS